MTSGTTKLVLALTSLVAINSTGCLLKSKTGSSTTSAPTKSAKECKPDLVASDDARMACIIDKYGDTERVGDVITFNCASFDVAGHNSAYGTEAGFSFMSQICPSAVYAGKLDPTTGGQVKIELLAKQNDFPAGEPKNGVKSIKNHSDKGVHAYRFVD